MSQYSDRHDEPFDSQHHILDSAKRSTRKAAPSPLQTSTTAPSPLTSATPTRSTFARGLDSPTIASLGTRGPDEPRSPKERLDDLLASEKSFYNNDNSSTDSIPERQIDYSFSPPPSVNAAIRSVSDSVVAVKPARFSPTTARPPPMAAPGPPGRAEMTRAAPRTSSIDSAISSMSEVRKASSSIDVRGSTKTPDIASVVQAAGSPEAVIHYLLKEKQSQAAQNTQLWRLVDKQRAMILGLNKDLERALKDKERYRKKLKEGITQMSNPSPVDSNQGGGLASDAASTSPEFKVGDTSKVNVEGLVAAGLRGTEHRGDAPASPIDVALAPYPITPPVTQPVGGSAGMTLGNMVEAEHKMPSPTKHAFQNYDPDSGFEASRLQRKAHEAALELPFNATLPPSRSLPGDPPRGPPPQVPPPKAPKSPSTAQPPTLSVIEASPNIEAIRAFPPPPRKAPPAPLNLGGNTATSAHLRQASGPGDDSDSDYDDILEVDQLPVMPIERGRRKTREDDDRERELAAMKDAELRSLSKKSAKSDKGSKNGKGVSNSQSEAQKEIPVPSSPRQAVQIAPPNQHLRQFAPEDGNTGSLAGMLSASHEPELRQQLVSSPLLSPGLPSSPRPIDRGLPSPYLAGGHSSTSPPLSPRNLNGFSGAVPLSPRAPRQPIPLPPNTPMSIASPGLPKNAAPPTNPPKPIVTIRKTGQSTDVPEDSSSPTNRSQRKPNGVYKGLVTDEYPDLLLPPNALPSIDLKVASSRLKPSRASVLFPKDYDEDPVFTLAVFARSDSKELWRVEKDSLSLFNLDQSLKKNSAFSSIKLPEKSLFEGHAPSKIDARRVALEKYFDDMLNTQMDVASALEICYYLSANAVEAHAEEVTPSGESMKETLKRGPGGRPCKSGYLTKRGKNFGGWQARFFVLDGPIFKYYESPGGPHLGTIKLPLAQIGKQNQAATVQGDDDVANQYRHAFLILEPKRRDSSSLVRHVLCAESDQERDEWVEALLQYVDYREDEDDLRPPNPASEHNRTDSSGSSKTGAKNSKKTHHSAPRSQTLPDLNGDLRGVSYENTKQGALPQGVKSKNSGTPSPPINSHDRDPMSQMSQSQSMMSISGPKNAQIISDTAAWGNRPSLQVPGTAEDKKQKKRSFFGFGTKPRVSSEVQDNSDQQHHQSGHQQQSGASNLSQMAYEQHGPIRAVFGAPLGEAVKYSHPVDVNVELPAVVYRCIEYLDSKNAALEEGIFRLSGSNVIIKQLRERFNLEGDVNLITDDQYYDIHAVASLLKLYLRELPSTILTRELHLEFIAVTELRDMNEKISALNGLVHRLPPANNALLRYLAGFLINIINHSDTNKMTVRNVGIVFSPTLNIPAPVFAMFLQQYDSIFADLPDDNQERSPVEVHVSAPALTPEDIRSPRRQKFQDLPTPSYDQSSFGQSQSLLQQQQQQHQHQHSQREQYDTGFTPLQPSYETQYPTGNGSQRLQAPENRQAVSARTKGRRESSMIGVGPGFDLNLQQSNGNQFHTKDHLVGEEAFFD